MAEPSDLMVVQFTYRNHRDEISQRRVRPIRIWFGCTAWHREQGWLLEAFDIDKMATRDFSFKGMLSSWRSCMENK